MNRVERLDAQTLAHHPLPAVGEGDKDERGAILIIAGSRDVGGAALLCATAAMRAGAGRLQIATVRSIAPHLAIAMPEAMVVGHAEDEAGGFAAEATAALVERAANADAIVAGPGLYGNDYCAGLASGLLKTGKALALDAAMLRKLPERREEALRAEQPPVLLPHAGELAALLECDEAEVADDPLAAGQACAERFDAITLVKGVQSHIVAPDGRAFLYAGGGPGLGVSGSGDTLAGIVGGLLARRAEPLTALLWAVWLHGEAGRRLGQRIGTLGYLAREIPDEVPGLLFQSPTSAGA